MGKETSTTESPASSQGEQLPSNPARGSLVKKILFHADRVVNVVHPIVKGLAVPYRHLRPLEIILSGVKAGVKEANKEISEHEKRIKEKKDGKDKSEPSG